MQLTANKDTLAYQLGGRPFSICRDMSGVPVSSVAARVEPFMNSADVSPETDALWFYMSNHAVAAVRGSMLELEQPLGKYLPVLELYNEQNNERAIRAFYYLLLICARESRHVKQPSKGQFMHALGPDALEAWNFSVSIRGSGNVINRLLHQSPEVNIGLFCKSLQWLFYNGSFGGGFGGPAWGAVTDCLVNFVTGVYSAEMMLDTVWTLAHNNGPIFNKGMLYHMYTQTIYGILDVQRSGQIPNLIESEELVTKFLTPHMRVAHNMFVELLGTKYLDAPEVNWQKVKDLGAVHDYSEKIEAQVKKVNAIAFMKKGSSQSLGGSAIKYKTETHTLKPKMPKIPKQVFEPVPPMFTTMPGHKVEIETKKRKKYVGSK